MTFRSKVDMWLLLTLLAGALAAFLGAAFALRAGVGWLVPTLIGLVGAALPFWILLSTKYTVDQGQVRIQSGPFRWCIWAPGITRITPTRSPLSSPALSLDRLRIEYESGKKSLLVSPVEPEAFIRAVQAARCAA
jgi:uncharacterized membrane protein YeaQ/YmgE (transglycosylase-associated protein family)